MKDDLTFKYYSDDAEFTFYEKCAWFYFMHRAEVIESLLTILFFACIAGIVYLVMWMGAN
jgi:hypothetical protein